MLKVSANHTKGQENFDIQQKEGQTWLNGQIAQWDWVALNEYNFHAIYQGQSFSIELVKADFAEKSFVLKINGEKVEYTAKDATDLLLEKMGLQNKSKSKVNQLKAPMPGLIVEVRVVEGQKVAKGDSLIILEAMKMENVIKSPTDGLIKAVKVSKGENVEKNKILIEFD
ncbi:MAG: acetyl-CoA carboxylase biotin carboxyl carrier protein subunit [Raineya sp.]